MTAVYKKLGNGDVEGGVVTPFLDETKTDFAQVPQDQIIGRARFSDQPKDYLLFAVLTTMFCCIPCGIVAMVRSMDVRTKWLMNDIEGAIQSSRAAKRLSVCSLVCGALFLCAYLGLLIYWVMYVLNQSRAMLQIVQAQQEAMFQDQQEAMIQAQQLQQAQQAQLGQQPLL